MSALPAWAEWAPETSSSPWTLGVEEEVMLLEPTTWELAPRCDDVLPALPEALAAKAFAETHGSALELATGVHARVSDAAGELGELRAGLAAALERFELRAGVAGTHPFAVWHDTVISEGERYQLLHDSLRELARREPTFGLHVHVAVPEAEQAVRALNRVRAHVPIFLALSGNSPFWQGRDTGLASARTPIFGAFPRTGIPRRFAGYAEYVEAIDLLLRSRAFTEPTFLWWDLRLQPRFGTLELRIMDAQIRVDDTAALVALAQCVVRLEALEGFVPEALVNAPEVLAENRFLACRDGMEATLIDPVSESRRPAQLWLEELLAACAPHAAALGCEAELRAVPALAAEPGAARQRRLTRSGGTLRGLVGALGDAFTSARPDPAVLAG